MLHTYLENSKSASDFLGALEMLVIGSGLFGAELILIVSVCGFATTWLLLWYARGNGRQGCAGAKVLVLGLSGW